MRVVFMGTPLFAVPTLEALHKAGHAIIAVYSQPPRPAGRGMKLTHSPVQQWAEAHHVPVFTPTSLKTPEAQAEFAALQADIAVVEIADGLLQEETARLVELGHKKGWFDGFVFAAGDAMGAAFGCRWLADRQIMPLAVSGLVSASPLASREAEGVTGITVATLEQLRDPVACPRIAFSKQPASVAA